MILSDKVLTVLVLLTLAIALATAGLLVARLLGERRSPSSLPLDRRVEAQLDAHAKALKRL